MTMIGKRPRVVIVGAGFGGLAAAQRLANRAVDVTIVDRQNHHLFQPLLYQVATAGLSPADIAAPIRSILANAANVRVILGEVGGIDRRRQQVQLSGGERIGYDSLILATGARHSFFGRDDWSQFASGLKSIDDAIAIRRQVLLALEQAEAETDQSRRRALLTFVVIGGGPTGVETAGAIAELARRSVSRDFRSITPHCSRVILIEAGERVLPSFDPALSATAEHSLRRLGVEVRCGAPVADLGDGYVQCGNALIFARTVVWAAGVQASPAAAWLDADHDRSGRVFVDECLRVPGSANIFVIGDTANAAGTDGRQLPATAPVAKLQGRYVADQLLGRETGPFGHRQRYNLATIGRSAAVIEWGGVHLTGLTAWVLWSVAHIWFLVGFRSRLAVALSWAWNYCTFQRSARLITGLATQGPRTGSHVNERKCA